MWAHDARVATHPARRFRGNVQSVRQLGLHGEAIDAGPGLIPRFDLR